MSTTFGVEVPSLDNEGDFEIVEIARRVGGKDGAELWWTNPLAQLLPDYTDVIALDNGPQGILTIEDIRYHTNT